MKECGGAFLTVPLGDKLQKLPEAEIDARNEHRENEHDNEHHARGFERLAERRPGNAFELGKGLFQLSAHAHEDIRLFVLILLLRLFFGLFAALSFRLGRFVGRFSHFSLSENLLRFFVRSVFFAHGAVFLQLQTVGIVPLVFEAVIISVFAHGTLERDF